MKKFEKLLKGHKSLVFLDFEGTQFSHEMIAIGAMHVVIDRHGFIKKHKKPFIFKTSEIFHFEILGKTDKEEHSLNI